jgi:hypothetical protein
VLKATARSVLNKLYRVAVGVFDPGDQLPSSDADPDRQREVAGTFSERARAARFALVDGAPGAVWAPAGRPRVAFAFKVAAGRIVEIDILADPEYLGRIRNSGLRTWSCRLRDLP